MISLICYIIAAICFLLAAIGRPAFPMLPIGLFFVALGLAFGGAGLNLEID